MTTIIDDLYCDLPALQHDSDMDSDDEINHTKKVTRKKSVNDIIGNTFQSDSESDSDTDTDNKAANSENAAILPQHKKGAYKKSII